MASKEWSLWRDAFPGLGTSFIVMLFKTLDITQWKEMVG